jgi:uncharacterized protein (TIGR03382 family)
MEIVLALLAAIAFVLLLRRRRRSEPVDEIGGLIAGAVPVVLADDRTRESEELEIEEGALDPDEAVDLGVWDEGADDELG